MESALSIFRKLPETKDQVSKYASLIIDSVLNGEVDALKFATQVAALEKLFKTLKSDILVKDAVLQEAEKRSQKSFEEGNAKYQIKEVGVSYDFSVCNSSTLDDINAKIKRLTEAKKKQETLLKSIPADKEVYDSNGVQLLPPVKKSTTQVVITLK